MPAARAAQNHDIVISTLHQLLKDAVAQQAQQAQHAGLAPSGSAGGAPPADAGAFSPPGGTGTAAAVTAPGALLHPAPGGGGSMLRGSAPDFQPCGSASLFQPPEP